MFRKTEAYPSGTNCREQFAAVDFGTGGASEADWDPDFVKRVFSTLKSKFFGI